MTPTESLDGASQVGANSVAVAVLEAVAEVEGRNLMDLPPLYDRIDPEALNEICDSVTDLRVQFAYCGYTITIEPPEDIHVEAI